MLEQGTTIFDCEVVEHLADDLFPETYLVTGANGFTGRLLIFPEQQPLTVATESLPGGQTFQGIGTVLRHGLYRGAAACLYPQPSGFPLRDLPREALKVRRVLEIVRDTAQTLAAPHAVGLSHGHLNPQTLYLTENGVYLADFGLPHLVTLDDRSGSDPRYISPEQVRGELPGPAADSYSLGCVLYDLLAGAPPFAEADPFASAMQHLQDNFPRLPDELELCQPLLDGLTGMLPHQRTSMADLVRMVEQLIDHSDVDSMPVRAVAEPPPGAVGEVGDDPSERAHGQERDVLAARIEERLQAGAAQISATRGAEFPEELLNSDDTDTTEALRSEGERQQSPNAGRYLVILLLGMLIGSGVYFLFFEEESPVAVTDTPAQSAPDTSPGPRLSDELDRGLLLWRDQRTAEAEALFRQLTREHGGDPRAYNNLAVMAAMRGEFDQARDYLEQALKTDPDYAAVQENLSRIYAEMARDSYGRALQLTDGGNRVSLQALSGAGVVPVVEQAAEKVAEEGQADQGLTSSQSADESASPAVSGEPAVAGHSSPETAAQETAAQETAAQETAAQETAAQETAAQETAAQETAAQETAAQETAAQETAAQETAQRRRMSPQQFLAYWAGSWSAQDVAAYLDCYSRNYDPPGQQSRSDWRKERRQRLTRPEYIEVELENLEVTRLPDGRVQVEFEQSYRSAGYADRVRKVVDLRSVEGSWRIVRERSLGIIQ